jgi:hypothetical protein
MKNERRAVLFLATFVISCGIFSGKAGAALIIAPNSAATVEGESNNAFPFNIAATLLANQRYQQVYDASQFATLLPTGGLITQILFRPDVTGSGAAFTSTLPSIRIDLSTTSAAPDGLSTTFASNVGLDDTIVYGGPAGAPLTLSSAATGPPSGPKDLDIVINLTTPFLYNPLLGNLLLDVRNFGDGATTAFDAINEVGDSVSRVFTTSAGVNSPTADGLGPTIGLVTGFTTTPTASVPDPASTGALLAGAMGTMIAAHLLIRRTRVGVRA